MATTQQDDVPELQFIDAKERQLFAEATLGLQVREFLISPAGRYLHGRAKLELEIAKDDLAEMNPFSFFGKRKWQAAQIRKLHAQSFLMWCADVLTEGTQAERKLEEYRE